MGNCGGSDAKGSDAAIDPTATDPTAQPKKGKGSKKKKKGGKKKGGKKGTDSGAVDPTWSNPIADGQDSDEEDWRAGAHKGLCFMVDSDRSPVCLSALDDFKQQQNEVAG